VWRQTGTKASFRRTRVWIFGSNTLQEGKTDWRGQIAELALPDSAFEILNRLLNKEQLLEATVRCSRPLNQQ
jgi:hypothetical protein